MLGTTSYFIAKIVVPAKNFIVMVRNEVSYHFGHPFILGILVPRLC